MRGDLAEGVVHGVHRGADVGELLPGGGFVGDGAVEPGPEFGVAGAGRVEADAGLVEGGLRLGHARVRVGIGGLGGFQALHGSVEVGAHRGDPAVDVGLRGAGIVVGARGPPADRRARGRDQRQEADPSAVCGAHVPQVPGVAGRIAAIRCIKQLFI
ncbi:hypothetical protein ACU686_06825 [Yinghuangia aomiensis]